MKDQLKALEAEIFPQRKSKRIHIGELQEAWVKYIKTMEGPDSLGRRVIDWLKRSVGGDVPL